MEKYQAHNKKHFYKYVSAETAKIILANRKLRYSSPLMFNDPFDVQTELMFNFDIDKFHDECVEEMIRLASTEELIIFEEETEYKLLIERLKIRIKKEGKIDPFLKSGLSEILKGYSYMLEETRKNYNFMWREFLKALRICSVSVDYDNILMWSHYSKNHTGVVFKLNVLHDEYNSFCVANPIIYCSEPLRFLSKEEFIKDLLGIKNAEFNKLFMQYVNVKYDIWSYENEWRIWTFEWENNLQGYTDYELFSKELGSIYFGCNTNDNDINDIKKLAQEVNPKVEFKKTRRVIGEYKLRFDDI